MGRPEVCEAIMPPFCATKGRFPSNIGHTFLQSMTPSNSRRCAPGLIRHRHMSGVLESGMIFSDSQDLGELCVRQ